MLKERVCPGMTWLPRAAKGFGDQDRMPLPNVPSLP